MTRSGTHYFTSVHSIAKYYSESMLEALNRIDTGAVQVGKPTYDVDKFKLKLDQEGRYWLEAR